MNTKTGWVFVAISSLLLSQTALADSPSYLTVYTVSVFGNPDTLSTPKKKKAIEILLAENQPIEIQEKSYRVQRDFVQTGPVPEKKIIVDPNTHRWSAYAANGKLVRTGLATAGGRWCPDIGRSCKTQAGVFRVYSLGSASCYSKKYPVNTGGGAPMPYCMYFNGGQGLHGSGSVFPGNGSHGCVRLHVSDAKWLRFNFVTLGTKVIIKPY
jgi:hypothetical protein